MLNATLSHDANRELVKWVRLWLTNKTTPYLTNTEFKKSFDKHKGDVNSIFNEIQEQSLLNGDLVSEEDAIKQIEKVHNFNAQIITIDSPIYPAMLKQIQHPPIVLCVKGNTDLFLKIKVAIVGSRNASLAAINTTAHFAKELAKNNICIVSGFASGVDTAACKNATQFGCIQVIATGLDVIYPKSNTQLYNSVLENGGLFVSEYPMGNNCSRWIGVKTKIHNSSAFAIGKKNFTNFPERNRIISGMSHYTIVSQINISNPASIQKKGIDFMIGTGSGSMNTAYNVIKQGGGRVLFAVPGNPNDEAAIGCNMLIEKNLARPIFSHMAILELAQRDLNLNINP